MPGRHSAAFSFAYVLASDAGALHVIDPGTDTVENRLRLDASLAAVGLERAAIATVFVTHLHSDHIGMARWIREVTGASLSVHVAEQAALDRLSRGTLDPDSQLDGWGVPAVRRIELMPFVVPVSRPRNIIDGVLHDGDLLPIEGRAVRVIWTPGHTPGSACLVDEERRILFSGDHLLPNMNPGLGLGGSTPTNAIADYLDSLDKIAPYEDVEVAPGHGYRFIGLTERAAEIRGHVSRRRTATAAILAETPHATVFELASRLPWSGGWARMQGFYLFSAIRQAELNLDLVTCRSSSGAPSATS